MAIRETMQNAGKALAESTERFRRLEIGIAAACAFSPVLMILFDSCRTATAQQASCLDSKGGYEEGIRAAISHYWDMPASVAFYVPLTIAVMLFVVNGVRTDKYEYNWILGVALGIVDAVAVQ